MEKVLEFFRQMGVAVCSRATLYRMQSIFVNPIIYDFWLGMQA
jgi:hypothetical protein